MKVKLISVAVFVVFATVAWSYFETPAPPISGLTRAQIDESVFSKAQANPASNAMKNAADRRKEMLEKRKNLRDGKKDGGKEEGGFFSRLFKKDASKEKEAVENEKPSPGAAKAGAGSPSRLMKREGNMNQSKRDFLAQRREERKARREALTSAAKLHTPTRLDNLPGNAVGGVGGGSEELPTDVAPPEQEIEELPPVSAGGGQEDMEE
jgi:hypothetical protein